MKKGLKYTMAAAAGAGAAMLLSKKTKENFPEWQFSSQLKEELVLLLDETLSTVLDGSFVHYDQKLGLIYGEEEKKNGTGV